MTRIKLILRLTLRQCTSNQYSAKLLAPCARRVSKIMPELLRLQLDNPGLVLENIVLDVGQVVSGAVHC